MKKLFLLVLLFFGFSIINAQEQQDSEITEQEEPTLETLKATLAIQKDSLKAIQKRVDATQKAIDNLPGWKIGAFGTIGGSLSNFDSWYAQNAPNNNSGTFSITSNAFANLNTKYFFWKNSGNANFAWLKFNDKDDPNDDTNWSTTTDVFNVSSLFGLKITEKFAASGLGEYRTTVIDNFNNPGYLDFGVGGTWTPISNLVVVFHPFNYNFVFSRDSSIFTSSMGTKILVDYTRKIDKINFKTNLSLFQSYRSSNLSNWTWINSFSYNVWKNFGIGFEFGLRNNKQEALKFASDNYDDTSGDPEPTFNNITNRIQTYYTLGISYKF